MSANISLLGWSATGLRCPDHEVSLRPKANSSRPYPVTLIQMPNGTGKTTTLSLLRATLSGSAASWTPKQVSELRRGSNPATAGKFVVQLAVDEKPLTFELVLNYHTGEANYRTSFGAGVRKGFYPPRPIARFLSPRFVDLFVFDGELANNLTDSQHTRAREAIDALFQLSLFDDVVKAFKRNWDSHQAKVGLKGEAGLTRRRNKLKNLAEKLSNLRREQRSLRARLVSLRQELQKSQEDYNSGLAKDKDTGERLEKLRAEIAEAESHLDLRISSAIAEMRSPHHLSANFGVGLQRLKANLDRLKLPTSTSKEFFEELSQANECICGNKMTSQMRQAIRDRVKLYLAEEEAGALNHIKSDIAKFCDQSPESYFNEHREQLTHLKDAMTKRDGLKTELEALETHRLSQGDSDLGRKKQRLDSLRDEIDKAQDRLDELERSPEGNEDDETVRIKAVEKQQAKAKADVAEATFTVELSRQTDVTVNILEEAQKRARQDLRRLIVTETNKRISQLLVRDPVLLSDINESLVLQGQGGASVGQTLSVGYAFLSTLFNRSDYELPFIVDSPAGPLDFKVRPQVAQLIPKLCKQFVAFTISSERERFVEPLAAAAGGKVQYLTIFRQTPSTNSLPLNGSNKSKKTRDGVIVEGRDFFNKFDMDEEGAA